MRRLLWLLAFVATVLWSFLAWGTYALLGWLGDRLAANADLVTSQPETMVWLSWLAGLLTSLGLAGVVVTWLIGCALILIVVAVLRLAGRGGRMSESLRRVRLPGSATGSIVRSRSLMRRLLDGGSR